MLTLKESQLRFLWAERVFQTSTGKLVDGRGITPDVVVDIDPDYYRDTRDRTLEMGIQLIREKCAANENQIDQPQ